MSAPELLNLAQSPYSPYSKVIGAVTGRNDCMNKLQKHIDENRRVRPEGAPEYDKLAIGLFAAIPAVIAYNKFSNELVRFEGKLEDFSTEFDTILSRQLEA